MVGDDADRGKAYGGLRDKRINRWSSHQTRLVMFRGDLRDAGRGGKGVFAQNFFSFSFDSIAR